MTVLQHSSGKHNQQGFTFIEVLVTSIITVMIVSVLVSISIFINRIHDTSSSKFPALENAQKIGHRITEDVLMAQSSSTDDDTGTAETEVLTLNRVGWPRSGDHNSLYNDIFIVRYTYDDNELWRHQNKTTEKYDENGELQGTTQSEKSIRVTDQLTAFTVSTITGTAAATEEVLITLTVTVDDSEVTRDYRITPRPGS